MNLFKKIYHKIFGLRRVDILKESLDEYISYIEDGDYYGLCYVIHNILDKYNLLEGLHPTIYSYYGEYVKQYFPKFLNPNKDITKFNEYWWDKLDTESRISFLEDLIVEYKDDKTDLYKYRDLIK